MPSSPCPSPERERKRARLDLPGTIQNNDHVIVELMSGDFRLHRVNVEKPFCIRKAYSVNGSNIVGLRYDVRYTVVGGKGELVQVLSRSGTSSGLDDDDDKDGDAGGQTHHAPYAEAKSRQRKLARSNTTFTFRRPTPYFMLCYFLSLNPAIVRSLTSSTLAFMLSMADIGSGKRVLVLDGTEGVAIGACMWKGAETVGWADRPRDVEGLRRMGYEVKGIKGILDLKLEAGDLFDAVIVTSKYDPQDILERVKMHIKPSCQIVFYRLFREQLLPTQRTLMSSPLFIDAQCISIQERQYQTFKGRMRPVNRMLGMTGGVLYATRVIGTEVGFGK